eukprot:a680179_3.p1 GENE.a680179_3~~a680179_3.p1  ORF type:complete len:365 (-),score=144.61 a680179_3:30-1070(-)
MAFTFDFGGPPLSSTVDMENRHLDSDSDDRRADAEAKAEFEAAYGISLDVEEIVGEVLVAAEERAALVAEFVTEPLARGDLALDIVVFHGFKIRKVAVDLDDVPLEDETLAAITQHSDLKQGVYEGGFKLWECAVDLGNLVAGAAAAPETAHLAPLAKGCVLELGCGHGLPGVIALQGGAAEVSFLDFNLDVLKFATLPNVALNTSDEGRSRTRFWAGDWARVSALMPPSMQFDLILSSETIYATSSYEGLHAVLEARLTPLGSALFATKDHYFGVGGGVIPFTEYIATRGVFDVKPLVTHAPKNTIARVILEVRRRGAPPAPAPSASGKGPAPAIPTVFGVGSSA